MRCILYTSQYQMKLVLVNIIQQGKQISIEVKIAYYVFHAKKLHSNDTITLLVRTKTQLRILSS